ncbi:ankyrin repeat-containing protein NPR4-like [Juglans regia]|uniref:Ankyrin repeat-containing protein NPR4-like n=1 Tax=Juglans regia TaxID=51240 RepID=A0A6P9E6Q3_JUGRE|nr:ankyrin repeat-containing protein NPR4-like [Juglans regia]
MLKANPEFLLIRNSEGMSIFQCAVLHRQAKICSLIYELEGVEALLAERDKSGNTILHLAGMLTEHTPIYDQIAGAALQMRREVQWFKDVESICLPITRELLNDQGLTPRQVFRKTHLSLKENAKRWMKETTNSGLVAATLIVTLMFTTAFTTPGGNSEETGLPVLINDTQFKIFMVTVSVSLFSSSVSLLMFLRLFTSRYVEEDFLISLPIKMTIGFFALFISIGTMIAGFCLAITLQLQGQRSILIPIILLVAFPLWTFSWVFIPLLDAVVGSSFRSRIFDRK